jgi:hypothetical protein
MSTGGEDSRGQISMENVDDHEVRAAMQAAIIASQADARHLHRTRASSKSVDGGKAGDRSPGSPKPMRARGPGLQGLDEEVDVEDDEVRSAMEFAMIASQSDGKNLHRTRGAAQGARLSTNSSSPRPSFEDPEPSPEPPPGWEVKESANWPGSWFYR